MENHRWTWNSRVVTLQLIWLFRIEETQVKIELRIFYHLFLLMYVQFQILAPPLIQLLTFIKNNTQKFLYANRILQTLYPNIQADPVSNIEMYLLKRSQTTSNYAFPFSAKRNLLSIQHQRTINKLFNICIWKKKSKKKLYTICI